MSRKTRRIARQIAKIASLGVAGLIVGLLSGCSCNANPIRLIPRRHDTSWQTSLPSFTNAIPFHHNHLIVSPNPALEQGFLNSPTRLRDRTPQARRLDPTTGL